MKPITKLVLITCLPCAALSSIPPAFAGSPAAKEIVVAETPAPWKLGDPISFYDGKLIFDVSYQGRFEFRENTFDFNSAIDTLNDDSWYLQRARLGIQVKPTDWLTFYGQVQSAWEDGSNRPDIPGVLGAEGDDEFDLRQAYIEIGDAKKFPLTLKTGRQVLSYGDQRLIGAFEWNNIARTFDAIKLRYTSGKNWVDLFASSVVRIDSDGFNESSFTGSQFDSWFSGIYSSLAIWDIQTTDIYLLWLDQQDDTSFATLGTRWKSEKDKLGPWDYTMEAAFQTGQVRDLDLTAFAATATVGYTFEAAWKPRVMLQYSFGSGDHDKSDGNIETFQNLYPTNHLYYGYMDAFSWQNIQDVEFGVQVTPLKNLKLEADFHCFWLADTNDAWYRANGFATVRPISPGANSYAGSELDITATYKATKWLSLLAGYSRFFSGEYLQDTGAASDANFVYVQAKLDF